jgi:hypothetical protein
MSIENDSNKSKRQKSEVSTLDRLKALTVVVGVFSNSNSVNNDSFNFYDLLL